MSMFTQFRSTVAKWLALAPPQPFQPMPVSNTVESQFSLNWGRGNVGVSETANRMYAGASPTRTAGPFGMNNTSADAELNSSLASLRSRSRQLVRDAAYARRAKVIVVNNVIGSGIGLQAQVMTTNDELYERVNANIEAVWSRWCRAKSCHTGGTLHFSDLERAAMGQIFEAGEVFIRKHPVEFGDSRIPFALELIEPERIADDSMNPVAALAPGTVLRMGIEVDRFGRPVAYWIRDRHPGELRMSPGETDRMERVPADQIIHLRIVDRWPQTRGEPWMHAVIRKLSDMDGYTEAEIVAARGAACYMATITTEPDQDAPLGEVDDGSGTPEVQLEPGLAQRLRPGEKLDFIAPNRPNAGADPFLRLMLREMAAGVGVSYESLSRDYSQSNYSSSRLSLLDDRDLWRVLQLWFIRSFRTELYEEWMQQAVYAGAIETIGVGQYLANPDKFCAVRFKPRGWTWIDPEKEEAALAQAVRDGFTTVTDVIAQTGGGDDIEDILTRRERELQLMKGRNLKFDTDPEFVDGKGALQVDPSAQPPGEPPARVFTMGAKR